MKKMWLIVVLVTVLVPALVLPTQGARDKSGVMKASDLIGKKVEDMEGKKLGDIKDLVIDPAGGEIEYVVLDFGGFLGVGDKYFAVPWPALQFNSDNKALMLDVSKRDLKKAPGFDKSNWPDMTNQEWVVTVYEFYEVPQPDGSGRAMQPQSK